MKAVIHTKYGSPENFQILEVDTPKPRENELLVKVHAATVNRTDCAMLRATPFIIRLMTGLFKPKNPILGTDFAGEVVEVGDNVSNFKVGDKLLSFDDTGLSSHAEYLTISEDKPMTTIPDEISFKTATASIEGVHYARNFINKVTLKEGDEVLVYGASGAIGSAMVQLLKYYNIIVTAVCDTKHIEIAKKLGADKVVDYIKEDFTKDTQSYHCVFDAVGKSSFRKCKPLLNPKGIYISSEMGYMVQNLFFALFTPIFNKKKVVFPYPTGHQESLNLVKRLLISGKFSPLIDRTYNLDQAIEAFTYVETGVKTGNVVITINEA